MDTARTLSSLRGLVQLQPMGPGPIPGTSGSPSPSHRLQRQGGFGGRKRRDSLAGGARRTAAGGGGQVRSRREGWRAGGDVSAAAAGMTSSAALRCAATDLGPRAGAPSVPPALSGSVRPPASIWPPGLGAEARAARAGLGWPRRQERGDVPTKVPAGKQAGEGPGRAASERSGERAGRRGGRGAPRANEQAERAEGASEGRQAVRSSFESNCLSQEEMWHLMQGEGRGKGPSGRRGLPDPAQGKVASDQFGQIPARLRTDLCCQGNQ